MDISQANDNELQKAIDDITKSAATETASDAVSELEAKIQNQLGVPPTPPMPEMPAAPAEAAAPVETAAPAPEAAPTLTPSADFAVPTVEAAPAEAPAEVATEAPAESAATEPAMTAPTLEAPTIESAPVAEVATQSVDGDLKSVKEAMMRDLFPLMDKVDVKPEQKYEIYKEMIEITNDKSMIAAAYEAAKGLADETARAEALLYLIEAVDK